MRANVIATISLAVLCCATPIELVVVDYRMIDHSEEGRIELVYLNDSGNAICLYTGDWPNRFGKLNQMSDRVFLVVSGERFPIEDFNTGYCVGDCSRRVVPEETITASIPYAEFRLPDRLRYEPKTLEFSPLAFVCR